MNLRNQMSTSLRVAAVTMLICSGVYTVVILAVGQTFMPATANGSLIHDSGGKTVGSELIAQKFTLPEYLWPRPSEVDYDGAAAGGSNLSPAGNALCRRAQKRIQHLGADSRSVVPADLVTASGSGLDPHITERAALFQADRIAKARGLDRAVVERVIRSQAVRSGWTLADEPLVNVLQFNMALNNLNDEDLIQTRVEY